MRRVLFGVFTIVVTTAGVFAQSSSDTPVATDSEIREILTQRVDKQQRSVGIVVGVLEPKGRRVVAHGKPHRGGEASLDGDTVFEIGSITKVFTALLLANRVEKGEAALGDPVSKYLPEGAGMPQHDGRPITLQHLATHTSGLPRVPDNLTLKDGVNPFADYSVDQLYEFLSTYELTRAVGSKYEYSNLGGGLLGHVLALSAGVDYEALVRSRICQPLGMNSTRITLSPEMTRRLATGHDGGLTPVSNWASPTQGGAGALRSTANDMLIFLAANLGYTDSPLAAAMASLLAERHPTGTRDVEITRGWHILTRDGAEIVWHNGGTGGYRSFVGFRPKSRTGVVVLSNSSDGVDDVGFHLLDRRRSLTKPPEKRKEITVDPKLFDGYVGRYQLAPNFIFTVTREDDRLFVQATGQLQVEIFPESERKYFFKAVDAQISFETDEEGRAAQLTLHQNGRDMPAKRIE